jgi:hypothetical protein
MMRCGRKCKERRGKSVANFSNKKIYDIVGDQGRRFEHMIRHYIN